jgi:hypothetical protein
LDFWEKGWADFCSSDLVYGFHALDSFGRFKLEHRFENLLCDIIGRFEKGGPPFGLQPIAEIANLFSIVLLVFRIVSPGTCPYLQAKMPM